ncbi:hypothetical protein RB16p018 [Escherichia phage RB16]|uniref:Conserved hypothetical phage protein n=1 Tax=Escherichia phage RB16 TaxID=2681599 RepID=D9IC79_BPRB1|nr:hypothetical protein RB16p018 [Escherichia phage RB16]ADJ55322.1 conserved hypothetical phage protein [Escherichia phage RB16]
MRIAVLGGTMISRTLVSCLIDSIRWVRTPCVDLCSRIPYDEPTVYKMKPYQIPLINRALHRQSVNRGK